MLMRSFLSGLLLLALSSTARCQPGIGAGTVNELNELNLAIEAAPKYDEQKLKAIEALKKAFEEKKQEPLTVQFTGYLQLYEAYKVFNYDSAFHFAKRLMETASQLGDPERLNFARLKLVFCLLSSGMFKETLDSLDKVDISDAPDSIKAEYYALAGRYYYDLGDFDKDTYYTPVYDEKGHRFIDSALRLFPPASYPASYYKGLKELMTGHDETAKAEFNQLIKRPGLSLHELAVAASTLSYIYIHDGFSDTAASLLIRAAIADIQSSTKETAAIFNLAELLYKQGDIKNASSYIEVAIHNASFYGARQRKVQVSAILPLIEGEKINRVEGQKTTLIAYSVIATLLLLLVIALVFIIFRQVRKLKTAQAAITRAHIKELAINQALVEANAKLSEANKIKEEYIGYFFNTNSEFFGKLEKFKKSLEQKLALRKWEDVIGLVNNINLKKEKEELLQNFDKAFLKLFPDFIKGFNVLFREEDQVQLKDHEFLNTDLRIFALIRMGIHDNEKIARILEYSVNTINTYKTRIKNKSTVPNEEFEQRIMEIKTL
jgi:tetratricopeptide (TPR) repeat protein